jgi:hypothetical protein
MATEEFVPSAVGATYNHTDEYADEQTSRDARERAVRTFFQGLGIDVGVALLLVLATTFTDIDWTGAYWTTLGLLLAKTFLQSVVSNLVRRLVPPSPQ